MMKAKISFLPANSIFDSPYPAADDTSTSRATVITVIVTLFPIHRHAGFFSNTWRKFCTVILEGIQSGGIFTISEEYLKEPVSSQ